MRIIQAIAIIVGLLAGVFLIGGQLLPGRVEISRSGELCHAPERIHEALSTPDQISQWALFSREADLPVEHGDGPGSGGWVRWSGNEDEQITWKIRNSDPPHSVDYHINLDDELAVSARGTIETVEGADSRLRMTLILQPESISGRWGLMLIRWIPSDDDFKSLLDEEIGHLRTFLAESAGPCEPAGTAAT